MLISSDLLLGSILAHLSLSLILLYDFTPFKSVYSFQEHWPLFFHRGLVEISQHLFWKQGRKNHKMAHFDLRVVVGRFWRFGPENLVGSCFPLRGILSICWHSLIYFTLLFHFPSNTSQTFLFLTSQIFFKASSNQWLLLQSHNSMSWPLMTAS